MEKGAAHTRRPLRHVDAQTLGVVPSSVVWFVDPVVGCAGVAGVTGVAPFAGVTGVVAEALVAGVVAVPFTDAGLVARTILAPNGTSADLAPYSHVTDSLGVDVYPVTLKNRDSADLHLVGVWTRMIGSAWPERRVTHR